MKVKVPGAHSSTGVKPIDFTLPATKTGEFYVLEIGEAKAKESENSPCLIHEFPMVVLDGPDDEKTGKTTQGRKYTHRIIQLLPEHEKYDENNTRAADELADLCAAADVDIDSDDAYDPEEFAGKRVKCAMGIRKGKDAEGNERPENVIRQTKDDEGHVHLWLPDDGKPTRKSPARSGTSRGKR